MIATMVVQIPLIDWLAYQAKCSFISDLRDLGPAGRARLLHIVGQIQPDAASLSEWNQALDYVMGAPPCQSGTEAKSQFMRILGGTDPIPHPDGSEQTSPTSIHTRCPRPAGPLGSSDETGKNG